MSLPPWTFTFLNKLANCPHKAFREHIARDLPKEEMSPEMQRGIEVHELLERRINGEPIAEEWGTFTAPLMAQGAKAEVKLGMTKDFHPAEFFAREGLWGRGKADVLVINPPAAFIVDWKTGKVREDDRELRQLALLVRANYPEIRRISGCYVWLKENRMGKVYDLSDVNRTYHGTVAAMDQAQFYENNDEWPKTPNALCGWCPVADCQFNTRAK